jgi:hypothetical protein
MVTVCQTREIARHKSLLVRYCLLLADRDDGQESSRLILISLRGTSDYIHPLIDPSIPRPCTTDLQ